MATAPSSLRRSPAAYPTAFPRRRGFQRSFFCSCGRPLESNLSVCRACAWEIPYSQRYFGGHRASVLERDRRCCRTCGAGRVLHVHHRRPGLQERDWLVTLCAGCHARVHQLQTLRYWLPPLLREFWAEQHPAAPQQLQFPLEAWSV